MLRLCQSSSSFVSCLSRSISSLKILMCIFYEAALKCLAISSDLKVEAILPLFLSE